MVIFGAATGLRPSELFGLEQHDVDLEAGVVYVRRAFANGRIKNTKTRLSTRAVPLQAKAVEALDRLPASVNPILFPNVRGGRIDFRIFGRRHWRPAQIAALVRGREEIFFGAEFDASAGTKKLPAEVVSYYVDTLAADAEALRGSFELYRAFPTMIAQNEQRKTRRLTMPVLAIGGEESGGERVAATMKLVADDVQSVVLPGAAHWVAEQAPEALLAALTEFLAPYRKRAE
jgi:pimeloyl-ACP methyl ester carboxylesterase